MHVELFRKTLRRLAENQPLSAEDMTACMESILAGEADVTLLAAWLTALHCKGESAAEITAAARVLRRHADHFQWDGPLLDTCGTCGDGLGSFNVSTVAAIVVAACGVTVAKHGNRAVSSRSGSADLLEGLGVQLEQDDAALTEQLRANHIAFLFAPKRHAAVRHASEARRALPFPTLFNLLGPLCHPAQVRHQLLGVFDPVYLMPLAETLRDLGSQRAWVVHGEGGIDELSPAGPSQIVELHEGHLTLMTLGPDDFGLPITALHSVQGGDVAMNVQLAKKLLSGEQEGPYHAVLLNAAAALCVADAKLSPKEAAARAAEAIASGAAARTLSAWVQDSTSLSQQG